MHSIRTPLALLFLASTIFGCGLALGIDDYAPDCDESNCTRCTTPSECGAPSACAEWTCETGFCKRTFASEATPCMAGVCDGTGQCVDCLSTQDCPVWEACGSWTCENKSCVLHPEPPGTIPPQVAGDCKATQCDATGQIVSSVDDTDAPPTTDCQVGSCVDGKPTIQVVPQGTLCNENGGIVCNGKGSCVECVTKAQCSAPSPTCDPSTNTCFSCADGIKNGDETDVDCGGDYCPKCDPGYTCHDPFDCVSGFCVDGYCCDKPCNELCYACNVATKLGLCSPLPRYSSDTTSGGATCLDGNGVTCDGWGSCNGTYGAPCVTHFDCVSKKCADKDQDGKYNCIKVTGDPCTASAECESNICTNGTCG